MSRTEKGVKATLITISVNIVLACVKIFTGVLGNSYALIADGVESIMDIFSSIIVMQGFRIGSKPPDDNHPWGHGKAESLAALFVALLLCLVAMGIAAQSIHNIIVPDEGPAPYTLFVLVLVIFSKEILFRFLMKKSADLDSLALRADAWHSRFDALTSLAAFIGIGIALLGGKPYASADDWAALFASGIILFNGARILRSATDELMDSIPQPNIEARIRDVAKKVRGINGVEKCRVRQSGSGFLVELHIEVDGNISVYEGHKTAHDVKDALIGSGIGIIDAAIHVEPSEPN